MAEADGREQRMVSRGLAQHEATQADDQAAFLAYADELGRRQQATFRILPARECLQRNQSARWIEQRLERHAEFAVLQGLAQPGYQLQPL